MRDILKRIAIKLTSFKNLICIWACSTLTYILVTKQSSFSELGWGLLALIGGCVGVNILQKKIENK